MTWTMLKDPSLVRQQACVAGDWIDADSGEFIDVKNPANGQTVARVPNTGKSETVRAIEAANAAWPDWKRRSSHERANLLMRLFDLILANAEDLARIMTVEQGKPLRESLAEIRYAASFVQWFSEQGKRVQGDVLASPMNDKRMIVLRQPVGVCAAITPWNFPAAMITRKVAPALAAGCPMVVKPSEFTPLSALALAELANRAGIPPGVLQVVTGDAKEIGEALTSSTTVRKLSFTGSTRVGRILAEQCAGTIKRVSLELGGHAPFIVFEDADIDAAVTGAIASKYRNAGQTCVCTNRFYIHDRVYEEFSAKLVERTAKLSVGDGLNPQADIGPLINAIAIEKVASHVADAVERGADLLTGGSLDAQGGLFFQPTVLGRVNSQMRITQEETFGPVAALLSFSEESEVVQLANNTEYGLAAYLYSRDISRVWRVAEALEYGMVGINTGSFSSEVAPFGGIKQSGIGREGSQLGIDEYLDVKYLCLGIGEID